MNISVDWEQDFPVMKTFNKTICTIEEIDDIWLTTLSPSITYSKMREMTESENSSSIDNAARRIYVATMLETLDNEYHAPGYVVAVIKELENELGQFASQPLQKLADCKKMWTTFLDSAVAEQKLLRKRKSDILDEITEQKNNK